MTWGGLLLIVLVLGILLLALNNLEPEPKPVPIFWDRKVRPMKYKRAHPYR